MTTGMLLDLLLATLLAATIVYAMILNQKLAALRQGREELRALIHHFTAASEKAQAGMAEMRTASEATGRALKDAMAEAQALREDLSFLMERGGVAADRMEQNVRASRTLGRAAVLPGRSCDNGPELRTEEGGEALERLRRILEATR